MIRGYQRDFSLAYESMNAVDDRQRKAATMLAVLCEALGDKIGSARLLNLGCSTGIIDEYLAGHVAAVTGVDIDEPAIALASSRRTAPNVEFLLDDAMRLSFADASFEIVICSQVYEHVPDPVKMMGEIHRVLRPGGVCYFAATNRWAVVEKHHRLPFLSWLPPALADRYIRLFRRGDAYYERHLGYQPLLNLVSQFRVDDYTGKILAAPDSYAAAYMFRGQLKPLFARTMFKYLRALFPGYIWLLRK
ncbi:class I SAM-dependent methyltransferase [Pseudolysobacter antarcticus]|uniref:Class I SAM-dependent methyltransferase n=1 Tax=Pseudolysobacter antarcticus TaxID=2511995 RepID=A0A411HGF9_9GAMM|nr:class I SAM-dependent methyltransferase [Pseudolysobacter antarcticus]QBB69582.1 class I SAM-dependent methyltransferase [Pseudolysobacter antarcticus]